MVHRNRARNSLLQTAQVLVNRGGFTGRVTGASDHHPALWFNDVCALRRVVSR